MEGAHPSMPGSPHFSIDRPVPLPILYLLTKKLNVGSYRIKVLFHRRAIENFDHRGHPGFAKKGF